MPSMFSRITQPSKVESIVENVRARILDGKLVPGESLPSEVALSVDFGVSRQSVREALRILVGEGLLRSRQGEGIFVREPSSADVIRGGVLQLLLASEELSKVQELRHILEPAIAEKAAQRGKESDFAKVEEVLTRMENRATRGESVFELAWEFHLLLADAAGNSAMAKVIKVIYQMIKAAEGPLYNRYFDPWQEIDDHRKLLAEIRKGVPALARDAMHAHLKMVDDRLAQALDDAEVPPAY